MKSYKKYVMVRHPLQRILSAYLDKLGHPLTRVNHPYSYFEQLKHHIMQAVSPVKYSHWVASNGTALRVEFEQFITWLVVQPDLASLNEHFSPQYYNSQPCRVRYDFYGNFDNFKDDFMKILAKFRIDGSSFLQTPSSSSSSSGHGRPMSQKLHLFWSPLAQRLKHKLYKKFKVDFDYYHSLYPTEVSITKRYLELPQ